MTQQLTTMISTVVLSFLFSFQTLNAQVGINTKTPNGILDINSSTSGFVLPRVSLISTISESPVVNPKTGSIPIGTTVYNTNTSTLGTNDVSPGMYAWDGSKWKLEFARNQSVLYEQSSLDFQSSSGSGFENVPGLTGQTFVADFTGTYRIKVDVNYAGASAKVPKKSGGSQSDGYLNVARASGTFRFTFGGTNYDIPAHAFSTAYEPSVSATNYFAIWQEYSIILYLSLTANSSTSFGLTFDQDLLPDYINDGNSGTGLGHIAYDIPCTIEIVYVGD